MVWDGWYNTGDIARIDPDGFIQLTGRQSRFSKIGGEMVPHIRVEEVIATLLEELDPLVVNDAEAAPGADVRVAVSAVPDEKRGERLIVLHKPLGCSRDDLIKRMNAAGLPNLWLPSADSFLEVPEIPLLGTGKLDLKALKETALAQAGAKSNAE